MKAASAATALALAVMTLGLDARSAPVLEPNACGDGRVDVIADGFESTAGLIFKVAPEVPDPTLALVPGCSGNALAIGYDLARAPATPVPWVVLRRTLSESRDITPYTHLRLALRGSNPYSREAVDVKLRDAAGTLYAVQLKSITDIPAWRPIYIDLRALTGPGSFDWTRVTDIEVGIVRCDTDCEVFDNPGISTGPDQHTGTLLVDELALVDLKPGGAYRLVQPKLDAVAPNATVLASAAGGLLAHRTLSGPGASLVPAWFPEANPNYNTYVQAEALLVFVYEYERTGNLAYRDAARLLAARLIGLQIPSGKTHAGAWYTAYGNGGATLLPPNRRLPSGALVPCDGDETAAADIDTCQWVGNVGWALIALGRLQRSGLYDEPAALADSLNRGAAWLAGQPAFRGNAAYPGLISLGIEGNISAYFGLLAARWPNEAATLGEAIFQFGWDPVQRRIKAGVSPTEVATALDVAGSWGATLLRSIGRSREALDSQAYASSVLRTRSFDGSVRGLGDIAGPFTVALEFTAQAAAAGIAGADDWMQQIYALQIASGPYAGTFPGSADAFYGGELPPWNTTMPWVSPTAWVYFAAYRDPLRELLGQLVPGFNLVGNDRTAPLDVIELYGTSDNPATGIGAGVESVWNWHAIAPGEPGAPGCWRFHTPLFTQEESAAYAAAHGYEPLTAVEPGAGYWVNATAPIRLPAQAGAPQVLTPEAFALLPQGFNLLSIGQAVSSVQELANSLGPAPPAGSPVAESFNALWMWDAGRLKWYFYSPSLDQPGAPFTNCQYAAAQGYLDFDGCPEANDAPGVPDRPAPARSLEPMTGFWIDKF